MAATAAVNSRPTTATVGGQVSIPREQEGFDMPGMAQKMWRPMLVMGLMTVAAGIVAGIVQAGADTPLRFAQIGAWNPGVLFLGIGFLLSTVTFVLAVILGELRDGGAKVQAALGAQALILRRPWTGKAFPLAMVMGLMTLMATFVIGFIEAARLDTDPSGAADIGAWVGPLRFAGVALVFTAVVLALATILRALRFQSDRVTQIAEQRAS